MKILWSALLHRATIINVCAELVARIGMKFNATKSMTMVFMPHETARRVQSTFPNFTLSGVPLNVVDGCKYLGHIISSVNDDNQDIARQMSLLYMLELIC